MVGGVRICVGKIISWCGLNEQGLVFLNSWFRKITKSRLPELMFSGHITIQYMFCMYFMIKKIILEGFNDRGEGNLRGGRGTNFKKTKKHKKNIKKYVCWLFLDVYWTNTTIFCMPKSFCIPKGSGMVPGPGEP